MDTSFNCSLFAAALGDAAWDSISEGGPAFHQGFNNCEPRKPFSPSTASFGTFLKFNGLPDVRKPASRKDAGSATAAQLVPERRAVIVIHALVFCTIRPVPFGITIKSGSAFQFVLGDSSAVAAH